MQVLFVCTGNTCRSPMAAALYNQIYKDGGADSAGICVMTPMPAAENAIQVMREFGADLKKHRAKQVSAALIRSADVILTMTKHHKQILSAQFPDSAEKIRILGEEKGVEIADPFGGSMEAYRLCAKTMEALIREIKL